MTAEIAPLLKVVVRAGKGDTNRERVRKLKKEADTFLLVGLGEIWLRFRASRRFPTSPPTDS